MCVKSRMHLLHCGYSFKVSLAIILQDIILMTFLLTFFKIQVILKFANKNLQ